MNMIHAANHRRLRWGIILAFGWTVNGLAMPLLPAPVFVDNGGVYTQGIPNLPVGNNGYTHPEDNPPPPGDSFNLPVCTNAPAAGVPAVTAFTAQAGNDRTVLMQGGAFTTYAGNDTGMDTRLWGTDANGSVYQPQILRVTNQSLAVLMSPPSGAYGLYLTWAENANGVGYPVRVNGTDAWWIGPDHAVAGSSVSVYGRNLSYQNGTTTSYVYIRPWGAGAGTASTNCVVTQVNPYKVTFTMPGNLAAGNYEVWIHNGHGGQYGWSGPLEFIVDASPAYQWNGTVHNVMSYGAYGDGVHVDSAAIQSAINACNPGDIAYLPAGIYMITNRLQLWNGVAIKGAGAASTTIAIYNSSYNDVAMLNSHWASTNLISSLTLSNGYTGAFLLWGMYVADNGGNPVPQSGIIISSCNFIAPPDWVPDAISVGIAGDFWVTNCTFTKTGAGVDVSGGRQIFVQNNTFNGNASNGIASPYGVHAGREADFNHNVAQSINWSNNQACTYFLYCSANGATMRDFYFGDNTSFQCGTTPATTDQNHGELILAECQDDLHVGSASAVGTNFVTFSGENWTANQLGSATLYVDNGPGLGTWRSVLSNSVNTVYLDQGWEYGASPDTTSHFAILDMALQGVIYHNHADGIPDYATRGNNASTGVDLGSADLDCVVANNTVTHTIGGINFGAQVDPGDVTDTNQFTWGGEINNLIVNNVVSNCLAGISCSSSIWSSGSGPTNFGPIVLNNVSRDNVLSDLGDTGISIDAGDGGTTWHWPWQQDNLFEYNTVVNCTNGRAMQIGDQQGYTIIRKNYFSRNDGYTGTGLNFSQYSVSPYFYQNYLTNPPLNITGREPGAGQNLGTRRLDFSATVGQASPAAQVATLWNMGTATLNVSVSTNQTWLSASLSATSIAALTANNSAATLTLNVNPAGLAIGDYTGMVTVTGGSYLTPETMYVTLEVMAPFVITSIARSGNNVNLAWSVTGGTTNVVQCANALGSNGAGGFTNLTGNIVVSGSGWVTNRYTDSGAATNARSRFYRVQMVP